MDAKDHPVISVLNDQKRFMVPIYQRQYSWDEKRWIPFWEDVLAKAEESLEGKPKFQHYMGALIIAPGSDGYVVGTTPRVQVVDGQQRLTTFQLFLAALREVGNRKEFPEIGESVQNYIFNRPMTGDTDPDAKFKLVPTPEDRRLIHHIMEGPWGSLPKKYGEYFYKNGGLKPSAPKAMRAVAMLIAKAERYSEYGALDEDEVVPEEKDDKKIQQKRLHALVQALLNHLKLVVITLDEGDDAQVIFETLNSRGEPLLAMDLVRNNIFHRAASQGEDPEKLFDAKWRIFDGQFWKDNSPRAKPKRPRIDHFLSHALTAQTGKEVSVRELYAEYRAFTRPKGLPRFAKVAEELEALLQFASSYQELEDADGRTELGWLGSKLAVWEVATAYPLAFNIAVSDAQDSEKKSLYQLIYSYLVRRAICGLTAKGLNKTFARVVGAFLENGVSVQSFAHAFADQTGPAVRFPGDEEFQNAVRLNPLYQWMLKKERLTDILWEFELKLRDKYTVGTGRPDYISIEHILPQNWREHWPLPDGRKAPSDGSVGLDEEMIAQISARQSVLHGLGNLTLVTVPANSSAQNHAFAKKQGWLKKSLLALNAPIIERDEWDEKEIARRARTLAGVAVNIWPALPS